MSRGNKKQIFVMMSGGVDSSVAAFLLKKQGYDCVGVFMRCYNVDGCAERDAEDARRVAEHIKIPFYIFDFEEEYKKKVVEYMIEGYRAGVTPNPDVMCNKEIKFGLFLKKALELGADYVATGHYVRRGFRVQGLGFRNQKLNAKRYTLYAAHDANKDQSYFLWTLTQNQLKYCLFPIGDYWKSEVREIARKAGLPTAEKKDSQGICFLGKIGIKDFLKEYIPEKRGEVLDVRGEKIGEHDGAQFYTIGQRHINIIQNSKIKNQNYNSKFKNINNPNHKPLYIVNKNIKTNTVVVTEGDDNQELYRKEIKLRNINFIRGDYSNVLKNIGIEKNEVSILARVRYRQPLASAKIMNYKLGIKNKCLILKFDQPIKFIAPGQSAVFYSEKKEMLGGGIII